MKKKLTLIGSLFLFFFLILPLLPAGRFFTLDGLNLIQVPKPNITDPNLLWSTFCFLLNQFFNTETLQKIIYIGTLAFLFFGSYFSYPSSKLTSKLIFAGILTFNPFVYSRFLSGQYLVIIGYTLFSQLLLQLLLKTKKNRFWITFYLLLLFQTSIHFFFIALLFITIYSLLNLKNLQSYFVILLAFLITLSLLIITNPQNTTIFFSFNQQDIFAFISSSDKNYGLIPNLLSLFGFWYEGEKQIIALKDYFVFWPIITLLWLSFSLNGFLKFIRNNHDAKKTYALILFYLSITGVILSCSVQIKLFTPLILALYKYLPVMYILREPQKTIGILAFFYAFFTTYYFEHQNLNWIKKIFLIIIIGLIYYPGFILGFYQNIRLSNYPQEWYQVKKALKTSEKEQILVLPWHMYLPISFANQKTIYNPAEYFFNDTLSARNYEVPALDSHENRIQGKHIEGLLNVDFDHDWQLALKAINIKYVLLLKEKDWQNYNFLLKEKGISLVFEGQTLLIYQISSLR